MDCVRNGFYDNSVDVLWEYLDETLHSLPKRTEGPCHSGEASPTAPYTTHFMS